MSGQGRTERISFLPPDPQKQKRTYDARGGGDAGTASAPSIAVQAPG